MPIQLYLGGSGSGKSSRMYEQIISESMEFADRSFLVLVPEQFSMQTQRELVRMHPAHGLMNIDVLSFRKLAYKVLEEVGADRRAVLSETGKNLILRRAASEKKDELTVLAGRMNRPGYISRVKSILSEFEQYEITGDDLERMIKSAENRSTLSWKLKDLKVLAEAFREYRKERFITGEELLGVFASVAGSSELLRKNILVLDGFTGFTPVQMTAMRSLMRVCPGIRIALTIDPEEIHRPVRCEHELFALSKKTIQSLYRAARETGTKILDPVILDGTVSRFRKGGELQYLEKSLFRQTAAGGYTGQKTGEISLHCAANPAAEVRFAADRIRKLVDQEGLRYREIAVITGDLPAFQSHIRRVFAQNEIPVFIDRKVPLTENPCLEFLRSALNLFEMHFSYESVFAMLRTGFAQITPEETDLMENYVLARGIRGIRRYESIWDTETRTVQGDDLRICEEARSSWMERLKEASGYLKKSTAEVQEYAEGIRCLMRSFDLQEELNRKAEAFRVNYPEKALEYGRVYEIIEGLLHEACELIGSETVTRKEFAEILDAGFDEAKVGIVPPGLDQVFAGDMRRTRLDHVKALLFLGMNDGWVPSVKKEDGLVSGQDREFLEEHGFVLAPGERENAFIERFYLYLSLTKPSMHLAVSCSQNAGDGSALKPSYLLSFLRKLFPETEMQPERDAGTCDEVCSLYEAGLLLSRRLQESIRKQQADPDVREMIRCMKMQDGGEERVKRIMDAAFLAHGTENLGKQLALMLYQPIGANSVSRLETFAGCEYEHFLEYGLRLMEREIYELKPSDLGSIFHQILERYALAIRDSGYTWHSIPEDRQKEILESCVAECTADYGMGVFTDNARNRAEIGRITRVMRRTIWALTKQIRAGSFEPYKTEASFRYLLKMTEGEMKLRGRIDRVDRYEEEENAYLKVIDYKSGNTGFDLVSVVNGLQLQLVLYLITALEEERSRSGGKKKIQPAGIFYYHMDDPLVDAEDGDSEEDIEGKILRKLRPDGILLNNESVIRAMDGSFEKSSDVIPLMKRKEEGLTDAAVSAEMMENLTEYVRKLIFQLGSSILNGDIRRSPYRRKEMTACTYCRKNEICGFDRRDPACVYRTLKEYSKEWIWKMIGEEDTDGETMDGPAEDGD